MAAKINIPGLVRHPDPRLTDSCVEVEDVQSVFSLAIRLKLIARYDGVSGIAAPQIGELVRVCAVTRWDRTIVAMINPVITDITGIQEVELEGCLSIPGLRVYVARRNDVKVEWTTPEGKRVEDRFRGHEARVVQHEIDHLNGVLILDHGAPLFQETNY